MKFATYTLEGSIQPRFGFKKDKYIVDVLHAAIWANESKGNSSFLEIPSTLKIALDNWGTNFVKLKELDDSLPDINIQSHSVRGKPIAFLMNEVQLLAPVPDPQSFRDFYAFEQHVRAAR